MSICTDASFELEPLERALVRCKKRVKRLWTLLGDDMSQEDANELTEAGTKRSIEEMLSSLSINFEEAGGISMALNKIDRDPYQMIRYGKDAKDIVDQMQTNLTIIEGVLDASRPHLDDNTNNKIDQLYTCCNDFRKEIATYRNIAQTIEDKGKKLLRAHGMEG